MISRLVSLRRKLSERQLDAVLISQTTNRHYLSGFTGSAGFLIISDRKAILVTDFRYAEQARSQSPDFQVVQIAGEFIKWLPELLVELGAERIGFEGDDLTFFAHRQLVRATRKLAPKARPRLVSIEGLIGFQRACKEPDELAAIEKAAALADTAVERAGTLLKPGMTEKELAWNLERFLRENGSEGVAFDIIAASGPNSALPHAEPTDRIILSGEPVVIDLGARVDGYCSDITRTIFLGEPNADFARIYRIVQSAQSAALASIRAGMNGDEADRLARDVIGKAGYEKAFGHGLGHGVGLDVHEQPRLGTNSPDILAEGMVFTLEPGIYLEGLGGVRLEDMVLLEKQGPRILTQAVKLEFPQEEK
ncbi:MAG: aminopeptidase P family protein [Chloroflexota bacterium]|nr:aminopeptidase P family protein [Chloroflexota bacterium]